MGRKKVVIIYSNLEFFFSKEKRIFRFVRMFEILIEAII